MGEFRKYARSAKGLASGLALLCFASVTTADENIPLQARLLCRTEKSYVVCNLPVSVPPGSRITYAESRLVTVPAFLEPAGATTFQEMKQRNSTLRLAFVVKKPGRGTLLVEARAVACRNSPYCPHLNKTVSADINVPAGG
jgi:hypothetical protein